MSTERYPVGTFPDYARLMRALDAGDPVAESAVDFYRRCVAGEVHPSDDLAYRAQLARAAQNGHPGAAAVLRSLPPVTITVQQEVRIRAIPAGTVSTTAMVPASNKQDAPPGVNLTRTARVGDATRDEYLTQLDVMFSRGYMDREEFDARAAAALVAKTLDELKILTWDLPQVPEPELPVEVKRPEGSRITRRSAMMAVLAGLCLAGACATGGTLYFAIFFAFMLLCAIIFVLTVINKR
jgi:Domain of unknown function (DUF1707)